MKLGKKSATFFFFHLSDSCKRSNADQWNQLGTISRSNLQCWVSGRWTEIIWKSEQVSWHKSHIDNDQTMAVHCDFITVKSKVIYKNKTRWLFNIWFIWISNQTLLVWLEEVQACKTIVLVYPRFIRCRQRNPVNVFPTRQLCSQAWLRGRIKICERSPSPLKMLALCKILCRQSLLL